MEGKGLDERNRKLEAYFPLVKAIAGRMVKKLPPSVSIDDLVGDGVFGLIDAVDKFDAARKVSFEAYSTTRISGAIIDGLRLFDHIPRHRRYQLKRIEATRQMIESRVGREATEGEIRHVMGMTEKDYQKIAFFAKNNTLLYLEETYSGKDGTSVPLIDLVTDNGENSPELFAEQKEEINEAVTLVRRLLEELNEQERLVIEFYYGKQLKCLEVGNILGVGQGRVSQIKTQALFKMRLAAEARKADGTGA